MYLPPSSSSPYSIFQPWDGLSWVNCDCLMVVFLECSVIMEIMRLPLDSLQKCCNWLAMSAMGEGVWSVTQICQPIFHQTGLLSTAHHNIPYTFLHLCFSSSPIPPSAYCNPTKSLRASLNTIFFVRYYFGAGEVEDRSRCMDSSARKQWGDDWQSSGWCVTAEVPTHRCGTAKSKSRGGRL